MTENAYRHGDLASIERIKNGWIVRVAQPWGRESFAFSEWDKALACVTRHARLDLLGSVPEIQVRWPAVDEDDCA